MSDDTLMPKHPKRPRDPAQLAKLVVDIATGEAQDVLQGPGKAFGPNIGRAGGAVGGAFVRTNSQKRDVSRLPATPQEPDGGKRRRMADSADRLKDAGGECFPRL